MIDLTYKSKLSFWPRTYGGWTYIDLTLNLSIKYWHSRAGKSINFLYILNLLKIA